MKNKFSIIFLGIIISLFFVKNCFALSTPDPQEVDLEEIGTSQAIIRWEWSSEGEGEISHFSLIWREFTQDSTKKWEEVLPPKGYYSFNLKALESGTEYEWKIMAVATDPEYNSEYTEILTFTTTDEEYIDAPEDEIPGGGEGDNTILNIFGGGEDGEGIKNIQEAADALMEFLVLTGFAVGPILIIYAAYLLLTKQGQPEAVTQAKKIIIWTIIALSIMLFAKGIPSVVKDLFN